MQSNITMKIDNSLDVFSNSLSSWIETKTDVDILKILKKIPDLGMKVVSIGGAGTFDAIFLTGIISVLLA